MRPNPRDLLLGSLAGALVTAWWTGPTPASPPAAAVAPALARVVRVEAAPSTVATASVLAIAPAHPSCASQDASDAQAGSAARSPVRVVAVGKPSSATGLHDDDPAVRLQALQWLRQEGGPPALSDLRALLESDRSEAVRMEALDALLAHPEATDAEMQSLLEQAARSAAPLVAEHARALLESRTAPAAALPPEPIEPGS